MRQIALIIHNVRSTYNVGAMLRTAEGLGVGKAYLTGYTPYPLAANDSRLPHIARKTGQQIHKTALGAEDMIPWQHEADIGTVLLQLKAKSYLVAGLEQAPGAIRLPGFRPPNKIALIVGREVGGIEPEAMAQTDITLEIPMAGRKESFNVASAAAMALYHLTMFNGSQLQCPNPASCEEHGIGQ